MPTTIELQQQIDTLKIQLDNTTQKIISLVDIFYRQHFIDKDVFSNPVYFNGNTIFKGKITAEEILKLTKTGGTAVIADGTHTVSIPVGGGSVNIITKNGIITSIT
jgi:hypothetical protein